MSGIIDSAGSKSGVIGTTELDYEEGEGVHAITIGSTQQTSYSSGRGNLQYVKIGSLVSCTGYLDTDGQTLATTGSVNIGLPFAITAGSSTTFTTGVNYIHLSIASAPGYLAEYQFNENTSVVTPTSTITAGGVDDPVKIGSAITVGNTSNRIIIRFNFSYQTDS